jgi:hypothetical protein
MFQINFKKLVTVEVLHDFYQSGKSSDFRIIPTRECAKVLSNLKLRFIPTNHGFFIGLQVAEVISQDTFRPFLTLDQPFRLSFYLIATNPHLFTISQLPDKKPSGQVFYLTNRFDKQIAGPPLLRLLSGHSGGDLRVSGNDLVRSVGGVFKYSLSQPGAAVTVTDSFSGQVVWPTPALPQGSGEQIECNLSKVPDGRYHLEEDNGFSIELYKDDQLASSGALGVVEIFSDSPVAAYQFLETLGGGQIVAHPLTYSVRFVSRQSIWRYFIIAQSEGVDLTNFAITNPAPDNFSSVSVPAVVESRYGAGKVALWESASGINFRETPQTIVNYQYDPPGPGNAIGQLAFPSPATAGPRSDNSGNMIVDGSGDPVYFSEAYIIL